MPCYEYKNRKYTATELLKVIRSNEQQFHKDNGIKTGLWKYEVPDIEIVGDITPFTDNWKKRFDDIGYSVKLGDLVSGDVLKAYPQLKDIDVI